MTCTPEINEQNAQRAQTERPGVKFGVIHVTIRSIAGGKIVISTRGEDDAMHDFSLSIDDVWLECPSSAQSAGDQGELYISEAGAKATSMSDGKTRIKGTSGAGGPSVSFKWPESGGTAAVAPLRIWPTKIVIEGHALGDPSFAGRVALLDLKTCAPSQVISLDSGGMITLSLTSEGFAQFCLAMPDDAGEGIEIRQRVKTR